jgi:hypothetical protein
MSSTYNTERVRGWLEAEGAALRLAKSWGVHEHREAVSFLTAMAQGVRELNPALRKEHYLEAARQLSRLVEALGRVIRERREGLRPDPFTAVSDWVVDCDVQPAVFEAVSAFALACASLKDGSPELALGELARAQQEIMNELL